MRKLLAVLIVFGLIPLSGHVQADPPKSASFCVLYDLDSATVLYPRMLGQGGSPWGAPIQGVGRIKTVGSTTTVTEAVVDQLPFTPLAAGDIIFVTYNNTKYVRSIAAKASGASITVNSAIDLSDGAVFTWKKLEVGAAATDGWISLDDLGSRATISVEYKAGDLTGGLDWYVECIRPTPGAGRIQVYPATGTVRNFASAAANVGDSLVVFEEQGSCRVGILAHTADPGDPTAENITIDLIGR